MLPCGVPGVGFWLALYGGGNGIDAIVQGIALLVLLDAGRYPLLVSCLARRDPCLCGIPSILQP